MILYFRSIYKSICIWAQGKRRAAKDDAVEGIIIEDLFQDGVGELQLVLLYLVNDILTHQDNLPGTIFLVFYLCICLAAVLQEEPHYLPLRILRPFR